MSHTEPLPILKVPSDTKLDRIAEQRVKNEGWRAVEDDFRTFVISQVVAELPQFRLLLDRTSAEQI